MAGVRSLGHDGAVSASGVVPPQLPRPPASRLARPSWRDSRLVVGVLLVVLATALGAKAVASARDTVPVYAAAVALKAGDRLTTETLRRVDVQLGAVEGGYLSAAADLPADAYALREVRAGELVPVTAVGGRSEIAVSPITLRAEADSVAALVAGSVVDVWVSRRDPAATQERYLEASLVLRAVPVAWIPPDQGSFGVSAATAAVQLLVPSGEVQKVITAVDESARFTLVPVPGSLRAKAA